MPRKQRVLSEPAATVLRRFLDEPAREMWGFQIIEETRIRSSTLYSVLHTLGEERRFLTASWEQIDPAVEGRPPRKLYRLDPDGADAAGGALDEYERHALERRFARPRPRPLGGTA